MIPVIFKMPDNPEDLFSWFDEMLVGPSFRQFIGELRQARNINTEEAKLDDARSWASECLDQLLIDGTKGLGEDRIQELSQWPNMLEAVQELVLHEGKAYWQTKLDESAIIQDRVTELREKVIRPIETRSSWLRPEKTYRSLSYQLGGLAALLLVGIFFASQSDVLQKQNATKSNDSYPVNQMMRGEDNQNALNKKTEGREWSWSSGNLEETQTAEAQINVLADSLDKWFDITKNTKTIKAFNMNLSELWLGCEFVMSMPLDSLGELEKRELIALLSNLQQQVTAVIEQLNQGSDQLEPTQAKLKITKQKVDDYTHQAVQDIRELLKKL